MERDFAGSKDGYVFMYDKDNPSKKYKAARQAAGMSISEMSAYLAVDERTVWRYEDGTRTPGGPVNKLYGLLMDKTEHGGVR